MEILLKRALSLGEFSFSAPSLLRQGAYAQELGTSKKCQGRTFLLLDLSSVGRRGDDAP
jgi:hypothetical protein